MREKYSEKELSLFETLGFDHVLYSHVERSTMYRMLVEHCFIENIEGEKANSVRRCMVAFRNGYPFRLTKDFDNLITL